MFWDVKELYWWSGLKQDVTEFVDKCLTCQQVKVGYQFDSGLLQPIKIPQRKREKLMDFISRLPLTPTKKYSIWVIMEWLTKLAHFLYICKDYSLWKLAKLYISEIVRLHRVSISIFSIEIPILHLDSGGSCKGHWVLIWTLALPSIRRTGNPKRLQKYWRIC